MPNTPQPSPPEERDAQGTLPLEECLGALASPTPLPARIGRFELRRLVGSGAFGRVYEAYDSSLQRTVALKVARPSQLADEALVERFHREARAAANLMHPNIVAVFDSGRDGPFHYIASAFVSGQSLAAALSARPDGQPMSPGEAAAITRKLAEALAYAHRCGIIHRDVKPANVMLREDGEPLLADFGLAARSDGADRLTRAGAILGTPEYIAPEQWLGKASPASDQYSLGCLLYELLTRQVPFGGSSPEHFMLLHTSQQPPPPRSRQRGVPRDLDTICMKCLEKDPDRRYATCQELADDLRRWQDGEPVHARPPGPVERLARWARRSPALASSLLAAALLAIVGGALVTWQWQRAASALAQARHERRQKALARADALCAAVPAAVPALLADLGDGGEEALERLREVRDGDGPRAARMRAALALHVAGPEPRVDELTDWMLEAEDPAEVLLVRSMLAKNAESLRGPLWQVAQKPGDSSRRFRALVALAAFDPEGPKWRELAGLAARELLAANPLHLGAWMEGLKPVAGQMMPAIQEAYRGAGPAQHRQVATLLLAEYAAGQPLVLAEALLEADVSQAALLRPHLRKHWDEVEKRLRQEVQSQSIVPMVRPPDPSWSDVPQEARKEVEAAGGLVAERVALCTSLPLARARKVMDALGRAGYRPVSARPWADGRPLVALAWQRDGAAWQWEDGLTEDSAQARADHARQAGWAPIDLAAYAAPEGERFALLWRKAEKGETSHVFIRSAVAGYPAITRELLAKGLRPCVLRATVGPGGGRLSGIWRGHEGWGAGGPPYWRQASFLDEATLGARARTGDQAMLDVDLAPPRALASRQARATAEVQRETRLLMNDPDDKQALLRRGRAFFVLHRDEQAMADLTAARIIHGAMLARALLHARAGRAREARADLAEHLKMERGLPALVAAAQVDAYLGEEAGLKALDEAAEGGVFDAEAALEAAKAHAVAAKVHLAREAVRAAGLIGAPPPWGMPPGPSAAVKHSNRAVDLLRRGLAAGRGGIGSLQDEVDWEDLPCRDAARNAFARAGASRRYAAVWRDDRARESECVHGLSLEEHLKSCRRLASQGYAPASLSVSQLPGEAGPAVASVWQLPAPSWDREEKLARRKAVAAALLMEAGHPEEARGLWSPTSRPTARGHLIALAGPLGVSAKGLLRELDVVKAPSSRRALVLALGELDAAALPADLRAEASKKLLDWYENDPDAGLHGAIDWLLRHGMEGPDPRKLDWGMSRELERIDREQAGKPWKPGGKEWYVNGQGQTLSVVRGPSEYRQGSPPYEPGRLAYEGPRWCWVPRTFAVSTRLVKLADWNRFRQARGDEAWDPSLYPAGQNGPVGGVTWFEAARYCNWLSMMEGVPKEEWCYPDPPRPGARPVPGYLRRKGYRLPTDAEWELACRAGTESACFFGISPELLPRYSIFAGNSRGRPWPVGQKRPNDLGLFDLHGNAWQWCHTVFPETPGASPRTDREEYGVLQAVTNVHTRGGSYILPQAMGRSAYTSPNMAGAHSQDLGFRVVRTLE
jgi:formylglycine-generating enzyme required for sulfatase activity/tRNA A-37 threonylcarbamoyl transferase component Bud32